MKHLSKKQLRAIHSKPRFIVGQGYQYRRGHRVEMHDRELPVGKYDTGTVVGYQEKPWWINIKNDRTGKIDHYHSSDVLPHHNQHEKHNQGHIVKSEAV